MEKSVKTLKISFEFFGLCSGVVICRHSGARLLMTYSDSVFVFQFCGILGKQVMLRRG